MKLQDLLQGILITDTNLPMDTEITGVSYDSRQVQPGDLFVAVTGFATDGHKFIPMAGEKGARAVLCETIPENMDYVQVPSTRQALATVSANWFSHPARCMKMIGVTGTNGKTSVTTILKSVLETTLNAKVGLIGTIENKICQEVLPTERTTPESYELQKLLRRMADAGCTHVVMEVSSHALSLYRVAGIVFDVGVFTNLTEDHLDFHKTMENYAMAKAQLFAQSRRCMLNADADFVQMMQSHVAGQTYTYGIRETADLQGSNICMESDRVELDLTWRGETVHATVGIPGEFTAYNCLSVVGAGLMLDVPLAALVSALATAKSVRGRVEVVPTPGADYTVLIDYAHTPDALENVLKSVRGFCKGRILAVFGCGGDRDPIKRPIMGKIGAELADLAIITSDNPRMEEPGAIIEQIVAGAKESGRPYVVVEDRRAAIAWAMEHAEKDDIIVLAGKGHETYQILGTKKVHLDEREVVAANLNREETGVIWNG